MKDPHLLPYILPNVFAIATVVSPQQFASLVLPSLKPLFAIKEPPQNMLTLLDNLNTLQEKTDNAVFRERTSEPLSCCLMCQYALQMFFPLYIMPSSRSMLLYVIMAFLLLGTLLNRFKVQERALGVVPGLCESIDYAEVQSVLFPRVAVRFSNSVP
jgi:SCY1-like protein 2